MTPLPVLVTAACMLTCSNKTAELQAYLIFYVVKPRKCVLTSPADLLNPSLQVKGAFQATGDKADEMRAKAPSSKDVKGEAPSALDTAEDAAVRTKFACRTVSAVVPQQLCDCVGVGGGSAIQIPQCASVGCPLQSRQQRHACMAINVKL